MATRFLPVHEAATHPGRAAYWRQWFLEHPDPTLLPRDRVVRDPAAPTATCRTALTKESAAWIRSITRDEPTLVRVALAALLALLAARSTNQDKVIVMVCLPGGPAALPLALAVDPTDSFRVLLERARTAYFDAADHGGVTAADPLIPDDFAFGDFSIAVEDRGHADDLAARPLHLHVSLQLNPHIELRYRSDLFVPETGTRLATVYSDLMAKVAAAPDVPLGPQLAADPCEQAEFAVLNNTRTSWPSNRVLHSFLEERAAATPNVIAIADDGTTYGELNRRANHLAHRLRALGVRPGDVVGVCLKRSALELTALYAVLKAGGAYLPVDPDLPQARINYMIEQSHVNLAVGDAHTRGVLSQVAVFVDATQEQDPAVPEHNPVGRTGPDDLCYVIYTSGSTGRPKAVAVEHRAIVNRLVWMQRAYPLLDQDVILHKTPYTFDVSVWEIFWWSLAGARICILPSGEERDPARIIERIAAHTVTTVHFVPSMLHVFLRYVEAAGVGPLSTLHQVFSSGEALPAATALAFGSILPAAHLHNLYGPTEAAVDVSHFACAQHLDPRRPVPIGRPIDNIRLYVLTRSGAQAPIGTPGHLHIAGAGLARGYLNAPELTSERFVPDTVTGSGRMYRTGDLARRLPGGDIEYLGRMDSQVKIRGYRVELGEIEHVTAACAGVSDCAVVARSDIEGDHYLCAYIVPESEYSESLLREALSRTLPQYMVPRHFVIVEAIPTSRNGKRDLSRLPDPTGRAADGNHAEPRDGIEQCLAAIWKRILGVERVGVHDDFFTLGGDSIKAVEVIAALREAGIQLSFQDLFTHATLAEAAGLAQSVPNGPDSEGLYPSSRSAPFALLEPQDKALLPSTAVDAYPLSALQTGLLYEVSSTGNSGLYHDVACYHVPGKVDINAFTAALTATAARHPIMRTSFHLEGYSAPLQVVHGVFTPRLDVMDLSGLSEAEQDAALQQFPGEQLAREFEPGETDLVRVHLHLLGRRGFQYSLDYHAAALDGWSVGVLNHDLFDSYFEILQGGEPTRQSDGAGYAAFVTLEQQAVVSAEQRGYWLTLMDGAHSSQVPCSEYPRCIDEHAVVIQDVPLPPGLPDLLARTAGELRVPVKSVLLAAHMAVMGFVAGTEDVLVGYEHSGRPEISGGERSTGLFLNTLPFRMRLTGLSWAELVRGVYQAEAELLPHRRYPMGEIKRALGAREKLFDSVFNFTHFHMLKDLAQRRGLKLVRTQVRSQTEFPFRAEFWQDAFSDELGLALHWFRGQFAPERIARIAGYYVRALQELVGNLWKSHATSTLLAPDEYFCLTEDFAGHIRPLPFDTLLDAFNEQVTVNPVQTAVSHGLEELDYRSLDEESDRLAAFLQDAGVERGDVVCVAMDRGVPWAVSVLGIFKAGAVYLPQEPGDPPERIASALRRAACRHVLVDGPHAEHLGEALRFPEDSGQVLVLLDYDGARNTKRALDPAARPSPNDPAYLIYTSGSTGEPSGALIHHRGMLNHLLAKRWDLGLTKADRVAQVATQCFDISVWQLVAPWLVGGRSVIFGQDLVRDLPAFLQAACNEHITILELVPTYLDALLTDSDSHHVALPALRFVIVTGETLTPSLVRRWFERYAVPVINAYGPTEASDDIAHHMIRGPLDGERVPVGRPIINTRIYVVGPDGRILPVGSFGEIVVTGPAVGLGYVNDPERSRVAFSPNPYDDTSPSVYRTGDVGRWLENGVLDCAGRVDTQVKVRGHRIELTEIEIVLSEVQGIEHVVVQLHEIAGEKLLIAHYTGARELSVSDLRAAASASLPAHMLPDRVIRLNELPLTRNGKVDRARLQRLAIHAGFDPCPEPPADALESELVRAYEEILAVPQNSLDVADNFFDRGGHSLAAIRLASRLDGLASLRDIVALPTIRALANGIRQTQSGRQRPLLSNLTRAANLNCPEDAPALVCFPFAGGSAVSYLPLARALAQEAVPVQVLGIDLPGRTRRDRTPTPVKDLIAEIAAEIRDEVSGQLLLLGHSAGTRLALPVAHALRRGKTRLSLFVAVASIPQPTEMDGFGDRDPDGMTDEEIIAWLADGAGLHSARQLSRSERTDIARAFRYDSCTARAGYATMLADPAGATLDCPVTVVLGSEDPLTRSREKDAVLWGRFGTSSRIVLAGNGSGHYLNATHPEFLAEQIIASLLGESR